MVLRWQLPALSAGIISLFLGVTTASAQQIIDDGATGFSVVSGSWSQAFNQGYQSDVTYKAGGTGSAEVQWNFTGLSSGQYQVWTTWTTDANRATNAPYTVKGTTQQTVFMNQQNEPDDLTATGSVWELLGIYTSSASTLKVSLTDLANGYVIADAVRIEAFSSPPPTISIADASRLEGDSGSSSLAFRVTLSAVSAQDVTVQYTTANNSAVAPGDYTATSALVTIPAGSLTASASVLIIGDTKIEGNENFFVNLSNPTNAAIADRQAIGTIIDDERFVDNRNIGFSVISGTWSDATDQGFQGDVTYKAPGTGSSSVLWVFNGLASGTYQVWATWTTDSNRATNAPYRVNGTLVTVNQENAPDDFFDAGVGWESLGNSFIVGGGTMNVTLSDAADDFVIADAVRIVKLP